MTQLNNQSLKQLFLNARSHNAWQDKALKEGVLEELFALLKMAPTSANCSPARFEKN